MGGWGKWARASKQFSWNPQGCPVTRSDTHWLSRFQLKGAFNYGSMLENQLAERINSCGILWWYAVSRCGGEVVYPLMTLESNEGFDGSRVHCGTGTAPVMKSTFSKSPSPPPVLSFPRELRHELADLDLLERVLRSQIGLPARVRSKARFLLDQIFRGVRNGFR